MQHKPMTSRTNPRYIEIDGFRLDDSFLPQKVRSATTFKPASGDVVIATYPKCGTTWMCQIAMLILRKGDLPSVSDYFNCCLFLEYEGAEFVKNMIRPGCIKTHLPFDRITFSNEAKYIYVTRHPRDCVVSFYYHTKLFPNYYFSNGTFDDFFELFIKGETDFNDYFDNLQSWYEHKDNPNIFFTSFETMKADHRGIILKVAQFLGAEYYEALLSNNEALLDKCVYLSSVDYMKTYVNESTEKHFIYPAGDDEVSRHTREAMKKALEEGETSEGQFVRSGKIGSGKTVLSEDQENRLQKRIKEKLNGVDVTFLWGTNLG